VRGTAWVARWAAPLCAALVLACDAPVAPVLVEGAERFDPPPVYDLWWDMTRECSGRPGVFGRLRWYYVPGAETITVNGRQVEGYWSAAGNAIVLAEAAMLDGPLVRHEMLHALQSGTAHPREFFLERCGGVVLCDGPCIDDAGPPPPADPFAARVTPDGLEIGVEIRPASPSGGVYGGFFAIVVTARNPRSDPVVVTLPATTFGEPSVSFEFRVESPVATSGGRAPARDEGVTRFAPGETKRQVFDVRASVPDGAGGFAPGTYRLYGAYGGHWSADVASVTVP
jgi:hypothetical protein